MNIPHLIARYRKAIIAVGGAITETLLILSEAGPAWVGLVAFATAALVTAVRNAPEPENP